MSSSLPAVNRPPLPPTTPLRAASMPQRDLEAHRMAISALVDVILDGYWQADMSAAKRALILADWCDELEDWPVDSIKAALRQHRRDQPSRKPHPGHIIAILKRAWGERNAEQARAAVAHTPAPQPMTAERHAEVSAEMADKLRAFIRPMPRVSE